MPKSLKYVVYREGEFFVSQCLNVDVSSFGRTSEEAIANLRDAVELYLADEDTQRLFQTVEDAAVGEAVLRHRQQGQPLAVWRDGKTVWLSPEEAEKERTPK